MSFVPPKKNNKMDHDKRACIAAAIALMHNGRTMNVYDYGRGKYVMLNSSIMGNNIRIFDYNRGGYFMGTLPNIFDYPSEAYVTINKNGNLFNGFDYKTASYFNGTISGNMVSIFDSSVATYFNYGV